MEDADPSTASRRADAGVTITPPWSMPVLTRSAIHGRKVLSELSRHSERDSCLIAGSAQNRDCRGRASGFSGYAAGKSVRRHGGTSANTIQSGFRARIVIFQLLIQEVEVIR